MFKPNTIMAVALGGVVVQTSLRAYAQQNPSDGSNLIAFNPIESMQFWLTLIVIICGLGIFAGQLLLLRSVNNLTADEIVRNCAITIVIIFATILIVAGYNSQQTAQAFGLFGTLIGYLLGRSSANNSSIKHTKGGNQNEKSSASDN
jgi:hypothetical protein